MPTPTKGARLGGSPDHQRHMLANLSQSLFEHGRITTTLTRAKRVQPHAERLVTFAKRGDLASRRKVMGIISDKSVVHTLFTEIGPGFADREGGYTRITKIGFRKGDNAPLAVIELVEFGTPAKKAVSKEAEKATKKAAPKKAAKKDETTASETAHADAPAEGAADADAPVEDIAAAHADAPAEGAEAAEGDKK